MISIHHSISIIIHYEYILYNHDKTNTPNIVISNDSISSSKIVQSITFTITTIIYIKE